MNEVEEALVVLQEAQEQAEREAQEAHARNHQELAREMEDKLLFLSLLRNEVQAEAGAGRVGPPSGLLDAEGVEARKRRILQSGGFRV